MVLAERKEVHQGLVQLRGVRCYVGETGGHEARVVPLRRVVPRRDPRMSSAAAVASRRVMARAALRELLDSIYFFGVK